MLRPPLPRPASAWALFFDFDGTLADSKGDGRDVRVDPALPRVLSCLSRAYDNTVAIVTSRPLAEVDSLLGVRLPGAGQHGAEIRVAHDGPVHRIGPKIDLREMEAALDAIAEADASLVVRKCPGALVLNYGAALHRAGELHARVGELVAPRRDLTLIARDCSIEIRPTGLSKGRAIGRLMGERPYRGRVPFAMGRDPADEDVFRFANSMRGCSVKVGRGPTAAQYGIPSVRGVVDWLQALERDFI